MKRIAVISLQVGAGSSKGHINPLIPVVQRLVADGHRVAWLSVPYRMGAEDRSQVLATGATVLETPSLPAGLVLPDHELVELAMQPENAWRAYESFLLSPLRALVEPVCEVLGSFQPDAIAVDSMAYAGIVAAERLSIPYVSICAGLKMLKEGGFEGGYMHDLGGLIAPRRALFRALGIDPEFRLLECLSPHANAVFATRALVGELELPPRTVLVGPSVSARPRGDERPFPWERLDSTRPLVYAAFGSVHTRGNLLDLLEPFSLACEQHGAQLVVGSESLSSDGTQLPGKALCVPYAPQLALLERASAFLTHGGANSVMEAVWTGTPLLIVPLSGDQPWQAHLVQQAGLGMALRRDEVSAAACVDALAALLDRHGPIAQRMVSAQKSYRAHDGACAVSGIIVQLAKEASHGCHPRR